MPKLNQILAVEKGVKTRVYAELTHLDREVQKPQLLTGISRTYRPRDDEGEELPPESTLVQMTVDTVLDQVASKMNELFTVTATKDWANTTAHADIKIGEMIVLADVPVTYLLFLEKQLVDLRTIVGRLPTLDPSETWTWDENSNVWATEPAETYRSKKNPRVIVKYDATPEHPAQTELISEDVVVGFWRTVKFSGALPAGRRAEMLDRAEALLNAVKEAREAANDMQIATLPNTTPILDYVFNGNGSA